MESRKSLKDHCIFFVPETERFDVVPHLLYKCIKKIEIQEAFERSSQAKNYVSQSQTRVSGTHIVLVVQRLIF